MSADTWLKVIMEASRPAFVYGQLVRDLAKMTERTYDMRYPRLDTRRLRRGLEVVMEAYR